MPDSRPKHSGVQAGPVCRCITPVTRLSSRRPLCPPCRHVPNPTAFFAYKRRGDRGRVTLPRFFVTGSMPLSAFRGLRGADIPADPVAPGSTHH